MPDTPAPTAEQRANDLFSRFLQMTVSMRVAVQTQIEQAEHPLLARIAALEHVEQAARVYRDAELVIFGSVSGFDEWKAASVARDALDASLADTPTQKESSDGK